MNRLSNFVPRYIAVALAASAMLVTTAHASCTPPPSGIVSWWQGEGNANDSWGTNNGVLQGGLGFTAGEVGLAF